jgi:hypothetical protein
MKRKLAGVAITMLLAGLAAGCGGDDGDDAGATVTTSGAGVTGDGPLTKAEFIERADAICSVAETRIEAAAAKLRTASQSSGTLKESAVVKFLRDSTLPAYDRMLIGLRGLTPPAGDEDEIDPFVASLSGALDAVKADTKKYAKRTTADPFDDANKRAQDYGMKVCGS